MAASESKPKSKGKPEAPAVPKAPAEPPPVPRLKKRYDEHVAPTLMKEFGLSNPHQVPRLTKIVVNCGVGRYLENQKLKPEIRDAVYHTLSTITGQRPVTIMAKQSVANFKVREGSPSGIMVTLRRERMWNFLDRLLNLAVPRIRDFRGLRTTAFDAGGSYSMGLTEQAVWPEINMAKVTHSHGMHINLVFQNSDPQKSRVALRELGMPFAREEER
jgi:large subunit ribosomal protein L5